jgi:hypothetical protein
MSGSGGRRVAAGAAVVLLLPCAALADGAFPDEFSIHFPAGQPQRILVGANFGLLVSEDDGASWRYSCEPYVTSGSSAALSPALVSFYQVTADDAVLAVSNNLTRSDDEGCTWPTSGGSIAGQVVTDVFPDPNDKNVVLGIVAQLQQTEVVISQDGGRTFGAALYATPDVLTGVEFARSRPGTIYLTKVSVDGKVSTLVRSSDYGLHWTETSIPAPAYTEPRILSVDPENPDLVYLRLLTGITDSVGIAADGGTNFAIALTISGAFTAFLRAGDGALYAGTMQGDLYVRPAGSSTFARRAGPHLRCLGQRPGTTRIYACGDMTLDGFSVGSSDDDGQSFQRVMKFTELLGPLTCPEVQTACAAHWNRIQMVLGISDGGVQAPDAGPTTSDGGTPPGGGGKGGSCQSAGASVTGWWIPGLWLLGLGVARRRQRPARW